MVAGAVRGSEGGVLWTVMPFIDCWELTVSAAEDVLQQEGEKTRLLLIDNGSSRKVRGNAENYCGYEGTLLWSHNPSLPSLAASWNAALDFIWETGADRAWVVNNDLRLHRSTARMLMKAQDRTGALFITAVGVTEEQFNPEAVLLLQYNQHFPDRYASPGGPDFSCFIITKECHQKYRFDEGFTPAYCEDLDYHRRLMLGGDGRRIFSVNVPFLHVDRGSGTLKGMSDERRRAKEAEINAGSRAYYEKKWGGPVNQERWRVPFKGLFGLGPQLIDATTPPPQPTTTPELQKAVWES